METARLFSKEEIRHLHKPALVNTGHSLTTLRTLTLDGHFNAAVHLHSPRAGTWTLLFTYTHSEWWLQNSCSLTVTLNWDSKTGVHLHSLWARTSTQLFTYAPSELGLQHSCSLTLTLSWDSNTAVHLHSPWAGTPTQLFTSIHPELRLPRQLFTSTHPELGLQHSCSLTLTLSQHFNTAVHFHSLWVGTSTLLSTHT